LWRFRNLFSHLLQWIALLSFLLQPVTISRAIYVPDANSPQPWAAAPTWQDENGAPEPESGPDWSDYDNDGLPTWYEQFIGTDPYNPDTDGDGITDGDEVITTLTNPLLVDTDGNGWSDYEDFMHLSDPTADADGDGLSNALEIQFGTDPRNPDSLGDGWTDCPSNQIIATA